MTIKIKFVPCDLWVGVYLDRKVTIPGSEWVHRRVYVCIVPCLPIIVTWRSRRRLATGGIIAYQSETAVGTAGADYTNLIRLDRQTYKVPRPPATPGEGG